MPSNANSETLYVPLEYPFIQDAINVAQEGDVIEVSAGQYSYCEVNETHPCSLTIQARESNGMIDDVYVSHLNVRNEFCSNSELTASGLSLGYLETVYAGTNVTANLCSISRLRVNGQSNLSATNCIIQTSINYSADIDNATASFQNCTFDLTLRGVGIYSSSVTSLVLINECLFTRYILMLIQTTFETNQGFTMWTLIVI